MNWIVMDHIVFDRSFFVSKYVIDILLKDPIFFILKSFFLLYKCLYLETFIQT